jgi:hypothetical protein
MTELHRQRQMVRSALQDEAEVTGLEQVEVASPKRAPRLRCLVLLIGGCEVTAGSHRPAPNSAPCCLMRSRFCCPLKIVDLSTSTHARWVRPEGHSHHGSFICQSF